MSGKILPFYATVNDPNHYKQDDTEGFFYNGTKVNSRLNTD